MTAHRWETPIGSWPAERFAPMLHDLVQWGLVKRGERGSWVLRDDVQNCLDAYPQPPAEAQVYVGYRCQECGTSAVTWASDGRHLCASCIDAERVGEIDARDDEPNAHARRMRLRLHRHAG